MAGPGNAPSRIDIPGRPQKRFRTPEGATTGIPGVDQNNSEEDETMEIFINVANIIYLAAYFNRDVLRMRMFSVVAASCLVTYFYFRSEPLMTPVYWNLFHMGINVVWIVRLTLERVKARKVEIQSRPAGISERAAEYRNGSGLSHSAPTPILAGSVGTIVPPELKIGPAVFHSIR
jgi:hypothetical protein